LSVCGKYLQVLKGNLHPSSKNVHLTYFLEVMAVYGKGDGQWNLRADQREQRQHAVGHPVLEIVFLTLLLLRVLAKWRKYRCQMTQGMMR
jgi:hypothetical protein